MADTPPTAAGPPQSGPSEPGPTAIRSTPSETSSGRSTGRTRISGAWVAVVIAAVVLVLLLVFILQNTRSVKVSYFTVNGTMPLGVALLLAAVGGVLLAGVVASLRIWQLRHNPAAQLVDLSLRYLDSERTDGALRAYGRSLTHGHLLPFPSAGRPGDRRVSRRRREAPLDEVRAEDWMKRLVTIMTSSFEDGRVQRVLGSRLSHRPIT